SVVVSALSPYEEGNITVFLVGLVTPVVVKLTTGEADSEETTRLVDYRLDLRIPGRGPNAKYSLIEPDKIALYDHDLQAFQDGLPPTDARLLKPVGAIPAYTQIWQ